jgi:hypothetical protein
MAIAMGTDDKLVDAFRKLNSTQALGMSAEDCAAIIWGPAQDKLFCDNADTYVEQQVANLEMAVQLAGHQQRTTTLELHQVLKPIIRACDLVKRPWASEDDADEAAREIVSLIRARNDMVAPRGAVWEKFDLRMGGATLFEAGVRFCVEKGWLEDRKSFLKLTKKAPGE